MVENAKTTYKVQKSKISVGKTGCTKAMTKLESSFDDFCKNKGTDVPMMRRVRFAAELVEAVEMSKNKLKELTNIVDTFIAVIMDLEEDYFTSPDKETVLTTVLTEQETYEEKHTDFLRKNDSAILE